MSGAALLGYAAVLSLCGASWLRDAGWTSRAPRLAIFTWFSLVASVLLALVAAGVLLIVPATGFHHGILDFIGACLATLEEQYGLVGGALLGGLSFVLAVGLPVLFAGSGAAEAISASMTRRRHLRGLSASARPDRRTGALVLDHDTAAAYCLPGRGGVVVVTTGAMRAVDGGGLAAVLHHERAHLAGRHHVLTALAHALHRPLCFLPLFAELPEQIGHLVELRADDVAAAKSGRRVLAESLLAFAEASVTPALALPAAGADTVDRMRRLITAPQRLNRPGAVGIAATGTVAMALPIVVTVLSLATVTYMACCSS
ncbi:M56 family metallopeptidase [Stackebrandtia nassauensis]|uniref:Peptidase M48 Ste24p n=1 Tax=Stackebrandtia nassauensis (strain DSM 44728 / CIP 108903 / NRRL B-16338 / NBRC 102104 / LLR-40K-21) TaxID=446470 RepID=D3Q7P4_STANL|nr:M56 family metallopeptidase [Stackebrandtia nassauensis]ADD44386.1 peptidase M48 Ste24p [Stackebrandtia nassauensis DSM 44728]